MATSLIPVDYTVKSTGFFNVHPGDFFIFDAAGNLCFQVSTRRCCHSSLKPVAPCTQRTVGNHVGAPLISDVHLGDVEVEVHMLREFYGPPGCSFRLRGNPFQRSCTVYRGSSIVAQTSLLYKLGKAFYSRKKFRLTVYPGMDHALIVALLVIFFG